MSNSADLVIPNPRRWFFAPDFDAECWSGGFETREETIAAAREHYSGEPFVVAECVRMEPSFDIFNSDLIIDELTDQDCWWEDGWTDAPDAQAQAELERRLEHTLKQWFIEFGGLGGACLEQLQSEAIEGPAPHTPGPQHEQSA